MKKTTGDPETSSGGHDGGCRAGDGRGRKIGVGESDEEGPTVLAACPSTLLLSSLWSQGAGLPDNEVGGAQ